MKDFGLREEPIRRRRDVPIICKQEKIPVNTTETPGTSTQNTTTDLVKAVNTTETPDTSSQNTTTDLAETGYSTETPDMSFQNTISDLIDAVNMINDLLAKLLGVLSDSHFIKSQ